MSAPIEEPSALLFARAVAMHGGTLSKAPVAALVEMIDLANARADAAEAKLQGIAAILASNWMGGSELSDRISELLGIEEGN